MIAIFIRELARQNAAALAQVYSHLLANDQMFTLLLSGSHRSRQRRQELYRICIA